MMKFLRRFSHKKELRELKRSVDSLNTSIKALNASLAKAGGLSQMPSPTGIPLAIIGTRGHGMKHIAGFLKIKDCYIHTICDVDTALGKKAADEIEAQTGHRPKVVQDLRKVLADDAVAAVSIATPHHWHALATVWALQAGKHVYVEKPITHSYSEGPSVISAAKKYKQIIQAGTQLRSNTSLKAAGQYMQDGKLGDVTLVHCIVHKDRPPVPLSNTNKIPKTVDFDLWCGPAEKSEVTRSKFHYHWHWLWRFGNGALGNNGIHRIDAARFALDLKGMGEFTLSVGDRYGPDDSGETPNNMLTVQKFGKTWVLQDILGLNPDPFNGLENAVVFYGTEGTIVYKSGYAALVDKDFKELRRFEGKQNNHYDNFIKSIKANDPKLVKGDLVEAIASGDLCHFGNISFQLSEESDFASVKRQMENLDVPTVVLQRLEALRQNLQKNKVQETIKMGALLKHSQNANTPFLDNPDAQALLSYPYRKGYELPLPDKV